MPHLGGSHLPDADLPPFVSGAGIRRFRVRVGRTANRDALGATIRFDVRNPEGTLRSLDRTVGGNGSFGGNTLVQTIGLDSATAVEAVTITWPGTRAEQVLRDPAIDRLHTVTQPD